MSSDLTHLDFWGKPLQVGDYVVYVPGKTPKLGQIVELLPKQVAVKQIEGPRNKRRWGKQFELDYRAPRSVIRAEGTAVTLRLLKKIK